MTTSTGRSSTTGVTGTGRSGSNGNGGDDLQSAASDLASQASQTAEAKASTAMDQVGHTLEQVAVAARQAGDSLRSDRPELAGVADTAADRVTDLSNYLREHDAGEVVASVEATARRQPALVIAGAFAVGLATARLLRSAGPSNGDSSRRYDRSSSDWYATGGSPRDNRYDPRGLPRGSDYASSQSGYSSAPYAAGTSGTTGMDDASADLTPTDVGELDRSSASSPTSKSTEGQA
jgi:hypothetical protein